MAITNKNVFLCDGKNDKDRGQDYRHANQCSNMPKMRWVLLCEFCSKFHTLSISANFFENRLTFDKVTESLKVGTFLRHGVYRDSLEDASFAAVQTLQILGHAFPVLCLYVTCTKSNT